MNLIIKVDRQRFNAKKFPSHRIYCAIIYFISINTYKKLYNIHKTLSLGNELQKVPL